MNCQGSPLVGDHSFKKRRIALRMPDRIDWMYYRAADFIRQDGFSRSEWEIFSVFWLRPIGVVNLPLAWNTNRSCKGGRMVSVPLVAIFI